jgi:hypothetical protein
MRLLHNMRQLMGQELATRRGLGPVLAATESNMGTKGEGTRTDDLGS